MAFGNIESGSSWTEEDHKQHERMTAHNRERLNSTDIDLNYPYAKQLETVKKCLAEAFGEYSKDVSITNSFLLELEFFMDHITALSKYKGEKKGEKYDALLANAVSGGNAIKGALIDYGMEARKKMKADLTKEGKTEEEIKKIVKSRSDHFLSLLREHIQYEGK